MGTGNIGGELCLHVNSGGEIDPAEVIGRERELANLLRTLEQQSVLVAAERRIGKTALCKKAQVALNPYALAIYKDIEHVRSTAELAGVLLAEMRPHLTMKKRGAIALGGLYKRLAGAGITLPEWAGGGGVMLPPALAPFWKEVIQDIVADVVEAQTKSGKRFVCLMLDEFPVAIENIRDDEGETVAMEILDLFRSLRATHGGTLRFVFTGSIGIHHIIRHLQRHGYGNRPLNDVYAFPIRALSTEDAQKLAAGLLRGEGIPAPDYKIAAKQISDEASQVPFYIHHIVNDLRNEGLDATPENIVAAVTQCIQNDRWDMKNYRDRLGRHFAENAPVAMALLDALAASKNPLAVPALVQRVRVNPKVKDTDEDIISETLDLLEQDFYIERDGERHTYRFLRPILARAWGHLRKLPVNTNG